MELFTYTENMVIFQNINSVRLNNPGLKYQSVAPSACKDIGITTIWVCGKTVIKSKKYVIKNFTTNDMNIIFFQNTGKKRF